MIIKPIPKHLLIHTVQYEEFEEVGSFDETFLPGEELEFVLLQPKTKLVRNSNGEEVTVKALMFLDAVNTPSFKPLKEKSKVHFKEKIYTVTSCDPFYALDPATPHHYEVSLE